MMMPYRCVGDLLVTSSLFDLDIAVYKSSGTGEGGECLYRRWSRRLTTVFIQRMYVHYLHSWRQQVSGLCLNWTIEWGWLSDTRSKNFSSSKYTFFFLFFFLHLMAVPIFNNKHATVVDKISLFKGTHVFII